MPGPSLDLNELPVTRYELDSPPLEEIAAAFHEKLRNHFKEVHAEVIECPDLTQEPYNLAGEGLGGNPFLIELGSPGYLLPLVNRKKCYDLSTIPKLVGDEKSFVIGAGAAPWPYVGVNAEGIINLIVDKNGTVVPGMRIAKLDENQKCQLEVVARSEHRCCLLANIFSSRGERCKVVKVDCKKRTGDLDFIASMRTVLQEAFPNKVIGMGGVFTVNRGTVKTHIMPDFSKTPLDTDEQLNEWLTFHKMKAPLSIVGTFVSKDPGLDLRAQHFHGFGKTEGGHYHYDVTPEEIEYTAILATGCNLARVDRPEKSVQFGKD